MAAIGHLTSLRTLVVKVDCSIPSFKFTVLPLLRRPPPPLRRLSVSILARDISRDLWVWCPALAPGATVQLGTADGLLALTHAPGSLAGCRLELTAAAVMIAYEGRTVEWMPQNGEVDLIEHLLRWVKDSGAECVMLRPCSKTEDEEEADEHAPEFTADQWQRVFRLKTDSGSEQRYELHPDPDDDDCHDGISEFQRELRHRCVMHGFRFAQCPGEYCVQLTRLA